mgnify:CR=1 FL=1
MCCIDLIVEVYLKLVWLNIVLLLYLRVHFLTIFFFAKGFHHLNIDGVINNQNLMKKDELEICKVCNENLLFFEINKYEVGFLFPVINSC